MLVKIATDWIDPARVIAVVTRSDCVTIMFQGSSSIEWIITDDKSNMDAGKAADRAADKVAEIVNLAIKNVR